MESQPVELSQGSTQPSSTIPKRKPLPSAAAPSSNVPPPPYPEEKRPTVELESGRTGISQRKWKLAAVPSLGMLLDRVRLGPLDRYLPNDQRKRRVAVGGILAGIIVLLALIIGLSAGLTVGRKHTQNLPLPTSNGGPYTGDLTYYAPGLGACGITSSSSDSICAVSHLVFDAAQKGSDPNSNPLCGLKLRLRRGGTSVDVTVVDRCVGCKATDIDTTTSVFSQLAEIAQGRVTVDWAWLETAPVSVP